VIQVRSALGEVSTHECVRTSNSCVAVLRVATSTSKQSDKKFLNVFDHFSGSLSDGEPCVAIKNSAYWSGVEWIS